MLTGQNTFSKANSSLKSNKPNIQLDVKKNGLNINANLQTFIAWQSVWPVMKVEDGLCSFCVVSDIDNYRVWWAIALAD